MKKAVKYCYYILILILFSVIGTALIFIYGNLDTEYAPGYSHSGFNAIKAGMSRDDVRSRLGEPFDISPRTAQRSNNVYLDEVWIYSKQGRNKKANFFGRYIYFNEQGLVKQTVKELYID